MEHQDTYAKRLKWSRKRKSMSQAMLAKKAGVAQSTIGSHETGTRGTKGAPRELFDIARVLDVDPEWLLSGVGQPFANQQIKNIIKNLQQLDEGQLDMIIRIIETVTAQPANK